MTQSISVAELFVRGVELRPFEAVAIARALIHTDPIVVDPRTPPGPPSLSTVQLAGDGTVSCCSCGIAPNVSEVALLLSDMLRKSGMKAAGGLQYAIARALIQVDAPPFDSIADFSRALQRFEQGARADVVRDLWTRAARTRRPARSPRFRQRERRQNVPSAATLRLELREADLQLYELSKAAAAPVPPVPARPARRPFYPLVLAGLALIIATVVAALLIGRPASPVAGPLPAAAAIPQSAPGRDAGAATPRRGPAERPASGAPDAMPASAPRAPDAGTPVEAPALVRAVDGDRRMFSPSFTADGSAMFFHTGRTEDARSALMSVRNASAASETAHDLHVVTILEDGARNYHVRPSPDGTRIAFDSDRDGERGVYIAASDGTNVRRISGPGYAAVPAWSPDGGRLAVVRGEPERSTVWNLWLYTLSTGEMVRLTNFRYGQTWGASWFPDGQRICYSHEDRLHVQDLDAGRSREYASPIPGRLVRTPAVSPNGQRVIFQVARHGAWLLDLTDQSMRVVLTDPTAEEFAWSPDGRRVAFHSKRDGGWGIWVTAGS